MEMGDEWKNKNAFRQVQFLTLSHLIYQIMLHYGPFLHKRRWILFTRLAEASQFEISGLSESPVSQYLSVLSQILRYLEKCIVTNVFYPAVTTRPWSDFIPNIIG